jgi:WD40 repeat protein
VGQDRRALIWDVQNGTILRRFEFWEVGGLFSVDLSPDGRQALIGTRDSPAILLNLESGQANQAPFGRRGRIECLVYHPAGRHVLAGFADGQVRLSDLSNGAEMRCIEHPLVHGSLTGIDVSPTGRQVLAGYQDHTLALWDVSGPRAIEIRRWAGHEAAVTGGVQFLPDGHRALSGAGGSTHYTADKSVRLWDLDTGRELCRFEGHTKSLAALEVSRDGRIAVSAANDGSLCLWPIVENAPPPPGSPDSTRRTGQVIWDFSPQVPSCLALGPDGRTVLVGLDKDLSSTPNYDLWLLDITQESMQQEGADRLVRRFVGHAEPVSAVAFSEHGRSALSGALSGTVWLWDTDSGRQIARLDGHTSRVTGAAFCPNGRFAVTGSQDGSLIVWNLETGEAIRRYLGHRGQVTDLCIAPDGRTVFSAGIDLTLREWRIDATQEALMSWIYSNRYVPTLSLAQRKQYRLDLLDIWQAGPPLVPPASRSQQKAPQDDRTPPCTPLHQRPEVDVLTHRRAFVETGFRPPHGQE